MSRQQMVTQTPKPKQRRVPWGRIIVIVIGLLLIAAGVVFNILNPLQGAVAFTALAIVVALLQWPGGGSGEPLEVDQAANVRASAVRLATASCLACGVIPASITGSALSLRLASPPLLNARSRDTFGNAIAFCMCDDSVRLNCAGVRTL